MCIQLKNERVIKMNKIYKVAIVGATGLVGRTILKVLEEKNFSNIQYTLFSSSKSAGSKIDFLGNTYIVCELKENSFDSGFDYAIFSAGASTSIKFAPIGADISTPVCNLYTPVIGWVLIPY